MSFLRLRATLFIAVLASTSSAVSLGNFKPFLDNLSASCTVVYNSQIAGCSADDFSTGAMCSSACMAGLAQIQTAVAGKCGQDKVSQTSIIGVFQSGQGIQALCPRNTASTTTNTLATTSSSMNAQQTSASLQSTSGTMSRSTGGIAVASSPPSLSLMSVPTAATTQSSASSSRKQAKATQSGPDGQRSNRNSGGGSPFDVQSTNHSSRLRIAIIDVAMFSAALFFLCLFMNS